MIANFTVPTGEEHFVVQQSVNNTLGDQKI